MGAGRTFYKARKTEILLIKPRSSRLKIILRFSLDFIFNHIYIYIYISEYYLKFFH